MMLIYPPYRRDRTIGASRLTRLRRAAR